MDIRVLFICSNIKIQRALEQTLSPLRGAWTMTFAATGKEALECLAVEPYVVVVSDLQLSDTDGATLLTTIAERYPEVMRFVLSSSDGDVLMRAAIPAHQYLSFPCERKVLQSAVEHGLVMRNLLDGEQLKKLIAQIKVLPTLPDLYLKVMAELRNPNVSAASIGKLIEKDVAMSAKVMKMVNSAYFSLPQQVTSPSLAVSLLGLNTVKSMILFNDVFTQFDRIKALVPGYNLDELHHHSLMVGNLARAIAKKERMDPATVDTFYMAGLFHDIGVLVLLTNMPQQYNKVMALARSEKITFVEAERMVFETTHAEVGAYLLGMWGFADTIIEASAFHHDPAASQQVGLCPLAAVHVANIFVKVIHGQPNASLSSIDDAYLQRAGVGDRLVGWLAEWRNLTEE